MHFPPVPEQEPLGPLRRIGGKYTLGKRLTYAPIHLDCAEELEETLVLGKDGDIYRGKAKVPSKMELDKKLRGTKRCVQKILRPSSTRGYVEPSLIVLHTNDKPQCYGKSKKTLIEMPTTEVENVLTMIKEKSIKRKNGRIISRISENEAAECEQEDLQSEASKVSNERLKELGMADEATAEIPAERHAEKSVDTTTKKLMEAEKFLRTGENTEESETESLSETDTDELTETEESLDAGEMKETTEESGTESLTTTDTGESMETDKSLHDEKMKEITEESEIESLEEADASELTETEESLAAEKVEETAEESDTESLTEISTVDVNQ